MKKVIVIVILAVYIASIAIVNFFGLEISVFDGNVYVSYITCDTVTLQNGNTMELSPKTKIFENGQEVPVFEIPFIAAPNGEAYTRDEASLVTNPNAVVLNYKVYPTDAADPTVEYLYDKDSNVAYFDTAIKTLVFLRPAMFGLTIKSKDGSNKTMKVYVRAVPESLYALGIS